MASRQYQASEDIIFEQKKNDAAIRRENDPGTLAFLRGKAQAYKEAQSALIRRFPGLSAEIIKEENQQTHQRPTESLKREVEKMSIREILEEIAFDPGALIVFPLGAACVGFIVYGLVSSIF